MTYTVLPVVYASLRLRNTFFGGPMLILMYTINGSLKELLIVRRYEIFYGTSEHLYNLMIESGCRNRK